MRRDFTQCELIRIEGGHKVVLVSYIPSEFAEINKEYIVDGYNDRFVVSRVFESSRISDYVCCYCKYPERLCNCPILDHWSGFG